MSKESITLETLYTDDDLLPILPLRDMVVFPSMVVPLFVGRPKSIAAIEQSIEHKDSHVLLFTQDNPEVAEPSFDDLISVGTVARIVQKIELPDGTTKLLVEGLDRALLKRYIEIERANQPSYGEYESLDEDASGQHLPMMSVSLLDAFKRYKEDNKKIPAEVLSTLEELNDPAKVSDIIAAQMNLSLDKRRALLKEPNVKARVEALLLELEGYAELNELEQSIRTRVKTQMDKNQKEYYLNEQMKAIQKELHDLDDQVDELDALADKIEAAQMPEAVYKKAKAELAKLKQMAAMSSEASVIRNYLDWLVKMPWATANTLKSNLQTAEKILNRDHYGLEQVKERLIEHLAVQKRVGKVTGSILCLVGPPGVGKTSLGKSIAEATNREFARIALGGVRDEAEIRGHRRTYIGALPGKIAQTIAKTGTKNPVILLDEIDKLGQDFRGDPSSALLEVLDPEQNQFFTDHFLEAEFDLSEVLFIATANSLNIPGPLLDRLEVIQLSGYTEQEKKAIAEKYLYPKQRDKHGLKGREIAIKQSVYTDLIRHYTREAGVRNLEREIAKICRKSVRHIQTESTKKVLINQQKLIDWLGPHKFRIGQAEQRAEVGRVNGLAWTQVGGELLPIEAVAYPGSGKLTVSGSLGDVMKESITAALTTIKGMAHELDMTAKWIGEQDIHVHVPDGATPKDGPSAGIAMCTVIVSALTKIPTRADIAMTGEVTLSGRVMPIGGLKEKLIAAHRGAIDVVLIPDDNQHQLTEVSDEIKAKIEVQAVHEVRDVLKKALINSPFVEPSNIEHVPANLMKNKENTPYEKYS